MLDVLDPRRCHAGVAGYPGEQQQLATHLPARGRMFAVPGVETGKLEGGKIIEFHELWDLYAFLK